MIITSRDKFKINGASSDSIGVYVDTQLPVPMARRVRDVYDAQDEPRSVTLEKWNAIDYSINFFTFLEDDIDTAVHAFFANPRRLEISRLPGYYYKIIDFNLLTDAELDNDKKRYTATFSLSPFRYKTDSNVVTVTSKNTVITNRGNAPCKPVYTITGSGLVELIVNGQSFKVTMPLGATSAVVDAERKIVYTGNALIFKTVGQFPFLAVGINTISWAGTVTSIEINLNERSY